MNTSTRNYDIQSGIAPTKGDKAAVCEHSLDSRMPQVVSYVFQELDSQDPVHKQFWDAMMVIAEVELQEALKQDELDWARLRGEPVPAKYTIKEAGLHESVDSDVQMMLAGRCLCAVVTQACLLRKQHLCRAGVACTCYARTSSCLKTFDGFYLFVHSFIHSDIYSVWLCWKACMDDVVH